MSRDPEGGGPELPDELPLDPVDSNLVDALDQMVDALQVEDAQARTVLLTARPELAEYTECLVRLDALLPASAVAGASHSDPLHVGPTGSSRGDGDRAGTRFGRYELLERIGHGAMGVVYLARQTDLDRTVALKLITPGRVDAEADVERFYSEARAAARLRHPGIVGVLEVGDVDGQHFIAMDYVSGGNLSEFVRNESPGSQGQSSHADDSVLLLTSPTGLW